MTRDELCAQLCELARDPDNERAHVLADQAILDYLNDREIAALWSAITKWYA